ncbi:MAG: nucleoside recognition protein [Bacteroidales bacterium]|nr:nucleoside recognition protein [Bacteroidales bacterium]
MASNQLFHRLLKCLRLALPRSLSICLWLLKVMLPISLAVRVLQYVGVIDWLAGYLSPVFSYIGLSGDSAFVFLTSIFLPLYPTIAVMTTLTLTLREATILAVMCLVSHNLPVECSVAHKTGSRFGEIVAFRIAMSFVAAVALNWLLPQSDAPFSFLASGTAEVTSWGMLLMQWLTSSLSLIVTIVLIVTALMVLQRVLEEFGWMHRIAHSLSPLMRLFGLPSGCSLLWLTGNVVGMAYGAAIMIDEVEEGRLTREEANLVNHHLGVSHSLLEDTMLFVAMGISFWWICLTRLMLAMIAVWTMRLWCMIRG